MARVEIAVSNTRAHVAASSHVIEKIDRELTYFSKIAPYHRAYQLYLKDRDRARREGRKARGWNGTVHLLRETDQSFPAGLSTRIAEFLDDQGIDVDLVDKRSQPAPHPKLTEGVIRQERVDQREWQAGAFEAACANPRGVFEAATGTGKTTLMAHLVAHLGQPTLILVNQNTLAKQTLARFQDIIHFPHADHPFGRIGDGLWEPGLITVATYQTLYKMLDDDKKGVTEWLGQFKAFHVDESHHVAAKTYFALTDKTAQSYWRYGYSATPFKNDRETELRLVGVCGEIIFSYTAKQAIRDGILTPPHIYVIDARFPQLKHDPETGKYLGNFAAEYKEGIVEHRGRNILLSNLAQICADEKLPTLVLYRQKKQGATLERLINDSERIDGSTPTELREVAKKRLMSGELSTLVASTIFNEGEDVPRIGAVVIGGGYRARHLAIQQIGRGLRPSPGKKFVLGFDVFDSHSLGLEKHSRERLAAWKEAGFKPKLVTLDELEALMDAEGFFG